MTSVAIIGAGVFGLFSALRLAEGGARVTIYESDADKPPKHAAAAVAAGMLAPASELLHEGPRANPMLAEASVAALALWRERAFAFSDHVAFDGAYWIAEDDKRIAACETAAERAQALGLDVRVAASPPSHLAARKIWRLPEEASVRAQPMLAALAQQAEALGVDIKRGVRAAPLGGFDRVVLAPGAWTSAGLIDLAPALALIAPAKGAILTLDAPFPLTEVVRGAGFYALPGAEGARVGATMEYGRLDLDIDDRAARALYQTARTEAPALFGNARIARVAVGVRPMSPDQAPLVGESGETLIAAGAGRNGWLLAPLAADIIAAHVFGESHAFAAAFTPGRFTQPIVL